jgi:hypothetical protein
MLEARSTQHRLAMLIHLIIDINSDLAAQAS